MKPLKGSEWVTKAANDDGNDEEERGKKNKEKRPNSQHLLSM